MSGGEGIGIIIIVIIVAAIYALFFLIPKTLFLGGMINIKSDSFFLKIVGIIEILISITIIILSIYYPLHLINDNYKSDKYIVVYYALVIIVMVGIDTLLFYLDYGLSDIGINVLNTTSKAVNPYSTYTR